MSGKVWLTSDWHFNHDKDFIWKARGFNSIQEMNEAIINRHNEVIAPDDTLYILGDVMLGGQDTSGIDMIAAIKGKKVIVAGNHDTGRRRQLYTETLGIPVYDAVRLEYQKYHFYLSHYPTITTNIEKESLRQCTLNLFGHTHQREKFYNEIPAIYHVGVDSHDCYPVDLDTIISDMKEQFNKKELNT